MHRGEAVNALLPAAPGAIAAVAIAFLTACGGGGGNDAKAPTSPTPQAPVLTTLTVSIPSTSLTIGQTVVATATGLDQNGAPIATGTLSWSSSATTVATVSSTGSVTAVGPGQAVITAAAGGRGGSVTLTVSSAPIGDVSVASAYMTQGVQNAQGSLPIVLGGGAAVVNVFLEATPPAATPMQVVLRLLNASGALIRSDTAVTTRTLTNASDPGVPSVQFLVPASVLTTGLRWQVVRDPRRVVPDLDATNDVFPRSGQATVATTIVPTLNIRFVPITLSSHNSATGSVTTGNIPTFIRSTRSVHPLGSITTRIGSSLSTAANFGTPPSGGAATFWTQVLSELDLARVADPVESALNWYGVVVPPAGFTFTQFGGFSYIPATGTESGPNTRTSLSVQLGWFSNPTQARDLVAHELGHTFGRRHAPCGNASNVDTSYPVSGGVLDRVGFDVYSWENGLASGATAVPITTGDVMGYCFPVWSSTYTYAGVLDFRGTAGAVLASGAGAVVRQRTLVVRGSVDSARSLRLEPSFVLDATPTSSDPIGRYRVEGRAADGRVLFSATVTPGAIDHAPGTSHFTVAVPLTAAVEDALQVIELSGPEGVVRRERLATATALLSAGASARRRGLGDAATSCGSLAEGIVVLDSRGTVIGSASASSMTTRLAQGDAVTLVCSDGVRSSRASVRVQ